MTGDKGNKAETTAKAARKNRLAEQLRSNLQRRKAQARARRAGAIDQRPDGIESATEPAGSASDQ